MTTTTAIKLGDVARDAITQCFGTVIGVTEWLHEPKRITLQLVDKTIGAPYEATFTEARLYRCDVEGVPLAQG